MSLSPCDVSRFSPEFQLACACCRVHPTARDRARIEQLLPQVDVPAFLDLVITRHRIAPLVHANLKRLGDHTLPAGLMAPLAASVRSNAVEAMRAVRNHVMLARWFGEAGIEWLPFKGITVAQRYYGDITLRQVHDQDIWVPVKQLQAARAVLAQHGFRWDVENRQWDLAGRGPRHLEYLVDYYFEEQHHSQEFGFVELHWKLTGNHHQFNLTPEQLVLRADRIDLGGEGFAVMNHVDLLLYLCEHGGRHTWYRLKWLADLPQLLEHETWDWPAVFNRAESAGCSRSLLLGFSLAIGLFGWVAPAAVEQRIRSEHSLGLVSDVVARSLSAPNSVWALTTLPLKWHLRLALSGILLSRGWRAVVTQIGRRSLSPKDLRLMVLPDRWFWLYRVVRPWLLGLRLWRAWGARVR